jgi:hypothetical protein
MEAQDSKAIRVVQSQIADCRLQRSTIVDLLP